MTRTFSVEYRAMQSRTACSIMISLRSNASRCGSHNIGAIGSSASDSLMRFERGIGLL